MMSICHQMEDEQVQNYIDISFDNSDVLKMFNSEGNVFDAKDNVLPDIVSFLKANPSPYYSKVQLENIQLMQLQEHGRC